MNNDFNPLKDLFPNFDPDKFQDDTVKFFSSVARENERNINAIKECLQDVISSENTTPKDDTPPDSENQNYQCPFPERKSTLTEDDICSYPKDKNITEDDVIDVEYTPCTDDEPPTENTAPNGFDPFSKPDTEDYNSNSTTSTKEVETMSNSTDDEKSKPMATPIDPFAPPSKEPTKPLSDREVIDKTSSMWKYNPISSKLEIYPECMTQVESTSYAEVLASRVRGKKHKHNATNCDDYFEFSFVGNCCVVAVSDGAGSKEYSRVGAKEVTTSYVHSMKEALSTLLKDSTFLEGLSYPITDALFSKSCSKLAFELQNAVKSAYSALVSKFDDISKKDEYSAPLGRDVTINDLSCTLLSGVIIPIDTPNGLETFVVTLQIGDGLICSIDDTKPFDSCVKILGVSDSGNFSGETEFITASGMMEQSNLMRRIKVMKCKSSAVVFATDGVSDDYFPNESKACNLYNDLVLNGVIPIVTTDDSTIKIVPPIREQKTIEETPKDVCVAYSEDIQEFFGISDETLWNDKSFVNNAISVYSQCFGKDKGENLQRWLDNYTKRGSFDDRTLFIYIPRK